ncbi:MAG: aconitate hydratase [Abditibacteriota bacterium]|nr:aconitate hydratase [Abditibacteriota bacterium]
MGYTIAEKIIKDHLISGEMIPGKEIAVRIDNTLTQDATGTMAYLQFEAIGIPRVKTRRSVSFVDHNTLQSGFENADDHAFLQSVADKYGIWFSRPGNGICHQVELERFAVPGETLLGSDSHTPTAGGLGMFAMGAGGLDVAAAMAGEPFYLPMPGIVNVVLTGALRPWVSAKDVILCVLQKLTVKGGVGKVIEYSGEGVASLSVPERATITNMGAELGATTSIFPADETARKFLKAQGRESDYRPLFADEDACYQETIEIDLSEQEPLIACPHMPDIVKKVSELEGLPVDQVCIGSCTNGSLRDVFVAANAICGRTVAPNTSLTISPGSKQVLEMITLDGTLNKLVTAGARILESTCGPCIGMGQSPRTNAVSVRTFNRNFEGRSGTKSAQVYLASPETAIAAAVFGKLTDPRKLGEYPVFVQPAEFLVNDNCILRPSDDGAGVEIVRGPNIKPLPVNNGFRGTLAAPVALKAGDNVTTDHIMPAGSKILPLRSNIPAISEYVFNMLDKDFVPRIKSLGSGIIVAGENYGQGSSREHAALAPMYLGVKAVIAKSFARIHRQNLVNFGIIPLLFEDAADYDRLQLLEELTFEDIDGQLSRGNTVTLGLSDGSAMTLRHDMSDREVATVINGGRLNSIKQKYAAKS